MATSLLVVILHGLHQVLVLAHKENSWRRDK